MTRNPILDFTVTAEDLSYIGEDLQRPECILAKPDGSLWAADARGGVVHIKPDGSQKIITQTFGNLKDQFHRYGFRRQNDSQSTSCVSDNQSLKLTIGVMGV